jgi:hypothetical protein
MLALEKTCNDYLKYKNMFSEGLPKIETVFIPYARKHSIIGLVISILFIALSAWLLSLPYDEHRSEYRNIKRSLSGIAGLILFGLLFILCTVRLSMSNLGLRLDENGLNHNIGGFSKGFITWNAIESMNIVSSRNAHTLVILTRDGKKVKFQLNNYVLPYDEVYNQIQKLHKQNTSIGSTTKKRR